MVVPEQAGLPPASRPRPIVQTQCAPNPVGVVAPGGGKGENMPSSKEPILLGGTRDKRPYEIGFEEAAEWLLGDEAGETGYNRESVRLYDFAATEGPQDTTPASPRDRVTLEDLGRMSCLAASLRYKRAHALMSASQSLDWPTDLPRLDSIPTDQFIIDTGVQAALQLFRSVKKLSGIHTSTTSKLLHLKWPAFFPIMDRDVGIAYGPRAAEIHNDSAELKGSRQRSNGEIRAYWLAFRLDLDRNAEALEALPDHVRERAHGDVGAEAHAQRLAKLQPLRLLDMLAWKAGRQAR